MTRITTAQLRILSAISLCAFMEGAIYSLQAPFYPAEAQTKGVSVIAVGVVLAAYEFAGFVLSPMIPKLVLSRIEPYTALHCGILLLASSTLLFGFLNAINNGTTFLVASICIRIVEAGGANMMIIASVTLLHLAMPQALTMAIGVHTTCFFIGLSVAPTIGGALYSVVGDPNWNFRLPFLAAGLVLYSVFPVTATLLRPYISNPQNKESFEKRPKSAIGLILLLKLPIVCIFAFTVFSMALCIGFNTCTLEPYLRKTFHLSSLQIGVMFTVYGISYAISTPIWGLIADWTKKPLLVMITGTVLVIPAFTLLSPIAILPLVPSVMFTAIGLVLFGLATGAVNPTAVTLMIEEAKNNGFRGDDVLVSTVSGVFMSVLQLGSGIGPILGGLLFQSVGFRTETEVPIVLFIILVLTLTGVYSRRRNPTEIATTEDETEPLLRHI